MAGYYSISSAGRAQRAAEAAQEEEEAQQDSRRSGLMGLGAGPNWQLGGTTLAKELGAAPGGLWSLATAWMPGGQPAGEVYSRAGKGIASSALGTVATLGKIASIPGTGIGLDRPIEALGGAMLGDEYKPKDLFEKAEERGILPALFEDVSNVALGAGLAKTAMVRAGTAGKVAGAGRAVQRAGEAGVSAEAVARAQGVGRQVAEQGGSIRKALKAEGLPKGRFSEVGEVARRTRAAEALPDEAVSALNPERLAKVQSRLKLIDQAAHPYQTVFRQGIRPLTRAAAAKEIAASQETARVAEEAARAAGDEAALRQAYGSTPTAPETAPRGANASERVALQQAYGDQSLAARAMRQGRTAATAADEVAEGAPAPGALDDVNDVLPGDTPEVTPPRIGPKEAAERSTQATPPPEWAVKATDKMRPGAQQFLARREYGIQGRRLNRVMREKARFAEADRRAVMHGAGMAAAREAAQLLIDRGIDPKLAEGQVFDAISRHLDQTAFLEEAARRGANISDGHPLAARIAEVTGQQFKMAQEHLADPQIKALLETAQAEWKTAAAERRSQLLGGRLGEKGLELIDSDEHVMTPRQIKEFRAIQAEYRRIAQRLQPLVEREAVVMADELTRTNDTMSRLAAEAERLTEARGAVREQINDLARPASLRTADRPGTFGAIAARVTETGGALFDPHAGRILEPVKYGGGDSGWLVGVRGRTASVEEWNANPQAVLDEFTNDFEALLQHPDAKVRVSQVGDKVQLDIAQSTIDGRAMSRRQALLLAQARGETLVANLDGSDMPVVTDPASMAVAAHHVKALLNPNSQLNRYLSRTDATAERLLEWDAELAATDDGLQAGPFLDDADFDGALQLDMRIAVGRLNAGRISNVDQHFGEFDVQARANSNMTPEDALLQTYLTDEFNPEGQLNMAFLNRVKKFLGPDADNALRWYDHGHHTVTSRWGDRTIQILDRRTGVPRDVLVSDLVFSILAITSVNASPISNMQTTMAALTNLTDYTKAGKWLEEVNSGFDEYLKTRERVFPAGVPSDPGKGAGKLAMEELARTKLYQRLLKNIPHMDNVRDDVFEILNGRLLDEWDNDYLRERFQRESLSRDAIARKFERGGTPALVAAEKRVAAARKAVDDAAAKVEAAKTDKGRAGWEAKRTAAEKELVAATKEHSRIEPKVREQVAAIPEQELMELEGSTAYAKMRSFHDNLKYPATSDGATLDRVMADLLGLAGGNWGRKEVYTRAADQLRKLAEKASVAWYGEPGKLRAHHLQAMLWVYCKRLTNEHDLGRLYASTIDALDSLDGDDALARWQAGDTAIHDYLRSDIEHFEETARIAAERKAAKKAGAELVEEGDGAIRRRMVPAVEMKSGQRPLRELHRMTPEDVAEMRAGRRIEQEQYSFFQGEDAKKVGKQLEARRGAPTQAQEKLGRPGTAKTWEAVSEDVAYYLNQGDKVSAQEAILAWSRDQAGRYSQEAEFFEDFFSRDPKQLREGYRPHGKKSEAVKSLHKLRDQGWIHQPGDPDAPTPLFQKFTDDVALGATFKDSKSGRMVMRFFRGADPTTLVHERAHLLRSMLSLEEVSQLERIYGGAAGDVLFEERFADDMVRHMNTGQAPNGLEQVFGRIRETLRLWWGGVGGKMADRIDPGVAEILDRYLDPAVGEVPDLPAFKLDLSGKTAAQLASALPPRPGESLAQAQRRGYQAGRRAAEMAALEQRQAAVAAREGRLKNVAAQLEETMATGGAPKATEMRKALAATDARLERFLGRADQPTVSRVPGAWKPLWGALDGLWKEAAGSEQLTAALEEMGVKTFPELVRYASEQGWDPTHVASLPDEKARRLAFDPLRLKIKETEAGTRKNRTQAFADDRSLAALAAAQVDVILEQNTNSLVSYIEDVVAQPLAEGQHIPDGWVAWSPTDTYARTRGVEGSTLRQSAGPARAQYMIPKHINRMLDQYGRNYDHAILSRIRSVSNPWRTLVLTWTPRWYANNVIGNMVLATKSGVRIEDWAAAWKEFRRGAPVEAERAGLPGRWAQRFGRGDEAFRGEAGTLTEGVGGAVAPGLAQEAVGGQTALVGRRFATKRAEARAAADEVKAAGGGRLKQAAAKHDVYAQHAAKANAVVDDLARAAVYVSQKRRGFSAERALQMSYEAMVDYGDLSPLERGLVRSVVPFYTWQKGILKQLAQFPVDHPIAGGLAVQLGQLNEEMHRGLPEAYQMLFDTPLGTLNLRPINPFQDAGALTSPQGIANSMNPFVGALARNAFGAPATGYPKYQRIDELGRVMPTTNPVEDFAAIATGLPQAQLAGSLAGQAEVAGRPTQEYAPLRYLGVPMVSGTKVEELRNRLAESNVRLAKFNASQANRGKKAETAGAATPKSSGPYASLSGRGMGGG